MTGRYLMRCANRDCEFRRRTSENPLSDGWPQHCGQSMLFATTIEEERFTRELDPAMEQLLEPVKTMRKALGEL